MKGLTNAQSGGGGSALDYSIIFQVEGADYFVMSCLEGDSVAAPPKPTAPGLNFVSWQIAGVDVIFPYTPTGNITMVANMSSRITVGFTGMTDSSGKLTWTDDYAELNSEAAYSLSTNGNNVTVNSAVADRWPFNTIEEFTDANGNVFVKFPKMWQKWSFDASGHIDGVRFCNEKTDDGFFLSDAYLKSDNLGVYNDYFALGKYEGSGSSSQMFSKSSQTCLVNVNRAQCRTAAKANGATYQQLDFAQFVLYNMLTMLKYRTTNIQGVYEGRTSATAATDTGGCDYITGLDGWNTATQSVKMNGIENPYGNIFKWVDGILFSGSAVYAHRLPTQFTDGTTNAVLTSIVRPSSGSYVKYLKAGAVASVQSYVYCTDASASDSTYFRDYYRSDGTVLIVGGAWDGAANAGLWFLFGYSSASSAFANLGSRLTYRPA